MSQAKKERKKRDTSKKHRVILEYSIEVFTRKGYDAASMDEIAEISGVSKRTIYNHFQSKENLFQEIVADFVSERDSIKPVMYSDTLSLEEQLKAFARAELFLIDDPRRRGISKLLTSVFLLNPEFGQAIKGKHSPYQAFILWLEAAKNNGRLHFTSPLLTARIFYGLVEGCLTWGALMSDGATLKGSEPVLDEMVAVFLSRYGT
jgi:TetR/AcrR family transcriptional regulator, regulator of autoinduction and epiphytic fitness